MRLKKWGLAALALAAVLLLAACGDGGEQAPPEAGSQPEKEEQLLLVASQDVHVMLGANAILEGEEASGQADIGLTGPTAFLRIGRQKKTGLEMMAVADNKGQNLAEDFTLSGVFDEYGDLVSGWFAQITAVDIDGDSTMELVACIGDRSGVMQAVVYRYQPGEETAFEVAGRVDGQIQMTIEEDRILVPHTEAEKAAKYTYADGEVKPA